MMGFFLCVLVRISHQAIKIISFINIIFLQIHCAECPFSVSATTRFHPSTLTFVICRGKSSLQKATGEASDEVLGQSTPPPFNHLCPGHRPRAQVIICVGFFFTCAQAIGRGRKS